MKVFVCLLVASLAVAAFAQSVAPGAGATAGASGINPAALAALAAAGGGGGLGADGGMLALMALGGGGTDNFINFSLCRRFMGSSPLCLAQMF